MARNEGPDTVLEGFILGHSTKAVQFQGVYWDEPEWIPRSQSEILEVSDMGFARLSVRGWLAKKNGWE